MTEIQKSSRFCYQDCVIQDEIVDLKDNKGSLAKKALLKSLQSDDHLFELLNSAALLKQIIVEYRLHTIEGQRIFMC